MAAEIEMPEVDETKAETTVAASSELMWVEVAYAEPDRQVIIPLRVPHHATIEQAIVKSGVLTTFPSIDLAVNKVGIFSKLSKLHTTLREKDRVEIYRKLIADPKEVRKQRAAQGKKMRKGGGEQD